MSPLPCWAPTECSGKTSACARSESASPRTAGYGIALGEMARRVRVADLDGRGSPPLQPQIASRPRSDRPVERAARRGHQPRPAQDGRGHDHARVLGVDAHRPLARGRRRVRPSVGRRRRDPGRATDGRHFWGTGRTASSDGQFFPAAGRGEALNLVNAPVRDRTRRQGVLARLRPILPVRHPDHPGHRPRSALHPRRAPDERDRAAHPRTVRRHGAASPTMSSPRARSSATRSSRASGTCRRSASTCSNARGSRRAGRPRCAALALGREPAARASRTWAARGAPTAAAPHRVLAPPPAPSSRQRGGISRPISRTALFPAARIMVPPAGRNRPRGRFPAPANLAAVRGRGPTGSPGCARRAQAEGTPRRSRGATASETGGT